MFTFEKATRKKSKLRLALCGVSGSGKTTAALQIAKGLGGRTALIDTESRSASLYADQFDFDALELEAPYTPERFIGAIEAAENAGYDNVIIDSMSHEWVGSGGCLEINDLLGKTKYKGNSFGAWGETGNRHIKFLEKIVTCKVHIIATVRMKGEHVQDQKTKRVTKVGMKYEMRDDFEFEFTSVFNIDREGHFAISSKDRTGLFSDDPFTIDASTGAALDEWLNSGKNFYIADADVAKLNQLLNQLPQNLQNKVRAKYPNFAEERAARYDEIHSGLAGMVEKNNAAIEAARIAAEIEAQKQAEIEAAELVAADDDGDSDAALDAIGEYEPTSADD